MYVPKDLYISFRHLGIAYDINLVREKPSNHSVEINGVSYAVLGSKGKLDIVCEILKSVSLDTISNVEDLKSRLSASGNISFSRNIELSKLIGGAINISSDADIRALCRECLAQNNNNTNLALISLKNTFFQAGVNTLSVKITNILINEASNKSIDESKAFGRKRSIDVSQFLKALPQRLNGAIDLTEMKKIGEGGSHDVFVIKNEPSTFVIKVNRESLKMKNNERIEKYITDIAAYQALHINFSDHCTVKQLLLRDIFDDCATKKAIISVAEFEVGFQKESKVALQADDFVGMKLPY